MLHVYFYQLYQSIYTSDMEWCERMGRAKLCENVVFCLPVSSEYGNCSFIKDKLFIHITKFFMGGWVRVAQKLGFCCIQDRCPPRLCLGSVHSLSVFGWGGGG